MKTKQCFHKLEEAEMKTKQCFHKLEEAEMKTKQKKRCFF